MTSNPLFQPPQEDGTVQIEVSLSDIMYRDDFEAVVVEFIRGLGIAWHDYNKKRRAH